MRNQKEENSRKKLEEACQKDLKEARKKLAVISFTEVGTRLARMIQNRLEEAGYQVFRYVKSRYVTEEEVPEKLRATVICEDLSTQTERWMRQMDGIVFVGAVGIAVRSIAPFLTSKAKDPAVLVLDEEGAFCIPLLSGHLGGANAFAEWLSGQIGAVPVITTATDRKRRFAVDLFAKENGLKLSDLKLAKEISAALLAGERIPVYCEKELPQVLPEGLYRCEDLAQETARPGIYIGIKVCREEQVLSLIPAVVTVGIGCRRGAKKEQINSCMCAVCEAAGIRKEAVGQVASIDLKAKEAGILRWCEEMDLPFVTYPADVLKKVDGKFSASAFVEKTTGVDNVCERSALLANGGNLIQKKIATDGVTAALAVKEWRIHFA